MKDEDCTRHEARLVGGDVLSLVPGFVGFLANIGVIINLV